jgi:hypothetical protein
MNKEKVREVLDFCYRQSHAYLSSDLTRAYWEDAEKALQRIEAKIEELTDEDLGEEE